LQDAEKGIGRVLLQDLTLCAPDVKGNIQLHGMFDFDLLASSFAFANAKQLL